MVAERRETPLLAGLRAGVLGSLDRLDRLAARTDSAPLARAELTRLTDGWRLLLQVHHADENGRCVACPHRLRGKRWPCQVWRLAHRHLIGDGRQHGDRHRLGARQPVASELPGELTMELPVVNPDVARRARRVE